MYSHVYDSYEEMSVAASNYLFELVADLPKALICPASGHTPVGLYNYFVNHPQITKSHISRMFFIGLDEWVSMNGDDEGSCRHSINQQLLFPLNIPEAHVSFFDGKAVDLNKECEQAEGFIKLHGGIDVAILGIGMNGHIGFNEPGVSFTKRTLITKLDEVTTSVGQKYFTSAQKLDSGITLGMETLLESRNIILLASGTKKAEIVKRIVKYGFDEMLPASALKDHPGLHFFMDRDAASML